MSASSKTVRSRAVVWICALVLALATGNARAQEISPRETIASGAIAAEPLGRYSDRTVVVGIEIDRDEARVLSFTVKPRPYIQPKTIPSARAYREMHDVRVEVILTNRDGQTHTRRVDIAGMCLSHHPESEPHIEGDTFRMHRESFLIELPELPGFDRVDVAYHRIDRGELSRNPLGTHRLSGSRFTSAATDATYDSLAFAAGASEGSDPAPQANVVIWPEAMGDPDIYHVYGDPSEASKRINVVIVPDGYTYPEKALMEQHAQATVDHFRNKTPFKEHDPFMSYTLVYAYSLDIGPDQCDCNIIHNTAMGTRFPLSNPSCGHTDNRCLSYGSACDAGATSNIVAAELRAPAQDETLVMVNTARYGGCGGSRATYAAGNGSALELAVHELGHSMSGLADEYFYNSNCGSSGAGPNVSTNAVSGDWPEWIADLGAPSEGGRYYGTCIYRPENDCEMRNLNRPFCAVCNQHWSLWTFGHPRVSPTAPIESQTPGPAVNAQTLLPVDFSVGTRLSSGAGVTNQITWTLDGPGLPGPTVVASGTQAYQHVFSQTGQYTMTCEVIGDTNFVKPSRYGSNVDTANWTVDVTALAPPSEVSPPPAPDPLLFLDHQNIQWEDASAGGSLTYNVYRGQLREFVAGTYGTCLQADLTNPFTIITDDPDPTVGWFYLVTGENPAGEGPMGQDTLGNPRNSAAACN